MHLHTRIQTPYVKGREMVNTCIGCRRSNWCAHKTNCKGVTVNKAIIWEVFERTIVEVYQYRGETMDDG